MQIFQSYIFILSSYFATCFLVKDLHFYVISVTTHKKKTLSTKEVLSTDFSHFSQVTHRWAYFRLVAGGVALQKPCGSAGISVFVCVFGALSGGILSVIQ